MKLLLCVLAFGFGCLFAAGEFTDSFEGELRWKPRFRSQLRPAETDTGGKILEVELDKHIFNGCGVELREPLRLEAGKEYVWSFSVRNPDAIPLAASPDGKEWRPLGGNPRVWRRHKIRFTATDRPVTLTIGANSPKKGAGGVWQLGKVDVREFSTGNDRVLALDNARRSLRVGEKITITPTDAFAPGSGWKLELFRGLDGNSAPEPLETLTVLDPAAAHTFRTALEPGCWLVKLSDADGVLRKVADFGVLPEKEAVAGIMVTDPEISGAARNGFRDYDAKNLRRIIADYRAVGLNMFAVTNIWPWYQPDEGGTSFRLADKVAAVCREEGVGYQLKIQQWSLPKNFHGYTRVKFQNGGEGRALSLWDERMVTDYIRLWEQAAERFAGDPMLCSYAPTFGLEENSVGNDYGGDRGGMADYSAPAAAAWREYLRKNFTSEKIAELYGGAPGELPLPLPAVHGADVRFRELWMTFLKFRHDRVAEVYDRVFTAIRAKDPAARITFKFGKLFPFEVECGPAGSNGYDFESTFQLAKKHRIHPAYTIIEEPVVTALMRGFSELYDVPLWGEGGDYPENGVTDAERKSGWNRGAGLRRTLGESRAMAVNAFLNTLVYGIEGLEIPYYPTANPKEIWAPLAAQLALAGEFRPHSGEKAYLGYFPERMWGAQFRADGETDLGVIYAECSERVRRRLRSGFPFRVITRETMDRLPADAVVFDPGTVEMTAETADALRRFVLNGGTLICNRYTALRGEGKGLLAGLLNTPMVELESTGGTLTSSGGIPVRNRELTGFRLEPEKAVLRSGDVAVAFAARAGKGRVVFNGVPLAHHPELEIELLNAAGERRSPWHSSLRAECHLLEHKNGDLLIVAANREDEQLNGVIRLPEEFAGYRCTDQISGVEMAITDGGIPCEIGNGMFRIFKLEKPE